MHAIYMLYIQPHVCKFQSKNTRQSCDDVCNTRNPTGVALENDPDLRHFGNQWHHLNKHEYTEIAMNYDVESHSHCSQPGPRCDFNSQIHKQEVIWACICFPLVCPIQHAIDISLLQWDPGPTHLPVREANDAPPKQNFLEQATKINKDISQDQTSLFSAYNKSAQTTIITFCDFFKFQKLQFGLGKAARTSKTRGLQRLGSRDQGQRDRGMI